MKQEQEKLEEEERRRREAERAEAKRQLQEERVREELKKIDEQTVGARARETAGKLSDEEKQIRILKVSMVIETSPQPASPSP